MLIIVCFAAAITIFLNMVLVRSGNVSVAFEESYYRGGHYISDSSEIVQDLKIVQKYKNEEHILAGGTLIEDILLNRENNLFWEFEHNSRSYNPKLSYEENYKTFQEVYAEKISQIRLDLIQEDLRDYKSTMQRLAKYQGVIYYADNGESELTNSPDNTKDYFKSYPSYLICEGFEQEVFPEEIKENPKYHWITSNNDQLGQQDIMYIAFTEEYLNPRLANWEDQKLFVTNSLYRIAGFVLVLVLASIYLILVIGKKPQDDKEVHLNSIDRVYKIS